MSKGNLGTIGQLLCASTTQVNFARLVNDLGNVLGRFGDAAPIVTWDCDDIAIFDMPGTRILLGWSDDLGPEKMGCLSVAVCPSHLPATSGQVLGYEAICVKLIGRVQEKLQPIAVFWHQVEGIITAADIDARVETLPMNVVALHKAAETEAAPLRATGTEGPGEAAAAPAAAPADRGAAVAAMAPTPDPAPARDAAPVAPPEAIRPTEPLALKAARASARVVRLRPSEKPADTPRTGPTDAVQPWRDPELAGLRDLLLAEEPAAANPEKPSAQMRLAVHAMNATLIVVYAPLGAALMTYSLLRGEDIRLTARALTLVGGMSLFLGSPLGHSLIALAGA